MHIRESLWLRNELSKLADADLFPFLDIGSSTLAYRTRVQPHIDANVFAPLRARGGKVIHTDVKPAPGVDVVGDLCDPVFLSSLERLGIRSLMVSNLLHHLSDRQPLIASLLRLVQPGGYIIVSGPYRYPRHYDPFDSMFRPTPEEVLAIFPGTHMVAGAIIDSGNLWTWNPAERGGRSLLRTLARLIVPFHRPKEWLRLVGQAHYIVLPIKAYGVVLRRVHSS
jgi:SAM-dependent methyltransferase